VNGAADALRGQLSAGDVDRLVLTRRYWTLVRTDPAAHADDALLGMLHLELAERTTALSSARDDLVRETARWAASPGICVVADTNVYLHHARPFEDLDWRHLAQAREYDQVNLVIPLLVVDELDRAKSGKARTRARTTLRTLHKLFPDPAVPARLGDATVPNRPGVLAHLLMDDLHHTRLGEADSELIDRAQALGGLVGRQVLLVTIDTAMAFRATMAGLNVRKLDQPD
jgi:hypothetical protein